MIKIMVVESCHLMRIGLIQLLSTVPNFEVIAGACNGEEAVQITQEQSIDVVLTELELPDLSGVEAVRQILIHSPHIKAIAVTIYPDECSLASFLEAGGQGYLTKDASLERLAHAIGTVAAGKTYVDPELVQTAALKRLSTASKLPSFESLLRREFEILKMISQGMDGSAIAETLRISPQIVTLHRY